MCCGTEGGSYLRPIDACITQLKAQGPSRTCNESKEEEEFGSAWTASVSCFTKCVALQREREEEREGESERERERDIYIERERPGRRRRSGLRRCGGPLQAGGSTSRWRRATSCAAPLPASAESKQLTVEEEKVDFGSQHHDSGTVGTP